MSNGDDGPARQPTLATRRLEIDGDWGLLELSGFGREYVQVYSALYALLFATGREADERIQLAFGGYPWTRGWSGVNFYDLLRRAVPVQHHPRVVAMAFASPGFIELGIVDEVAECIGRAVERVYHRYNRAQLTYKELYKSAKSRGLVSVDARTAGRVFSRADLAFAEHAAQALADAMDLDLTEGLHRLTDNSVARMKVVFSLYRRVRGLAELRWSERIRL